MKYNYSDTKPFLIVLFALLLFGVIMVYDVSVVYAEEGFGGKYYFLALQLLWVLVGLIGFFFAYKTSYTTLIKFARPLFLSSIVLLAILAIASVLNIDSPFFPEIYGAKRWILLNPDPLPRIPIIGILSLQPSELIKIALILYLATFLSSTQKKAGENTPFTRFLLILGVVLGLIIAQPDLGTALIISSVAVIMYFTSGADLKYFFWGFPSAVVVILVFILSSAYRRERLLTFLGAHESDPFGSSYHINQILIALGSGGFTGLGFGMSRQKYQYIPEAATDSIFAIIGEELGFIGVTLLILAFLYLIHKGFKIAQNAPDRTGTLIATGVTSWIAVQTFINLLAMVHLVPLTGVPLPLISYGGSSMVFLLTGIGILLNISKQSKKA